MSLDLQIRWLIRRDMPEVLAIENASFDRPWTDEDFLSFLRIRNSIGMVAEAADSEHRVAGFVTYSLEKTRLVITNLAVRPEDRRRGVGRALIERLVDKLSEQRRSEIRLDTREGNIAAQAFFNSLGFLCHGITRGFYDDTEEDAYHFRFAINGSEVPFIVKDATADVVAAAPPRSGWDELEGAL